MFTMVDIFTLDTPFSFSGALSTMMWVMNCIGTVDGM